MRLLPPLAIAVLSLLASTVASSGGAHSQESDALGITSNITYNVKNENGPVRVVWDVVIVNNDPETQNGSGTVFFYENLRLPVIRGAANATATDGDGAALAVSIDDPGPGIVQLVTMDFAEPLFYQETYSIRLAYELPDVRTESILITPNYAYLPLIAVGDEATVTVNTPSGDPWVVSLEAEECAQNGNVFSCAGGEAGAYLAATVEVSQPSATQILSFEVPLEDQTLAVTLTYLTGEDATAAHQRELATAALPLIEQAYGFGYSGPTALNISQGGRQSVLGYEGLASCTPGISCDVVISPIAGDYTFLHELSHLWSDVYATRWLAEGFAQYLPEEIASLMPPGLVQGSPRARSSTNVTLQLDDWGEVESVIGADDAQLATIEAGYDYSLRFLQELQARFGADTLRAVNRNIAGSGEPAGSQRFMDVMEDATQDNLDDLFLIWVFPGSYRQTLADRREAITRLSDLRARLLEAGLAEDGLVPIQANIREEEYAEALVSLGQLEENIDTYAELTGDLNELESDSQAAGLELPGDISDALLEFEFDTVRSLIGAARDAVASYLRAEAVVDEPRSLWDRFGLLGSDPDGELEAAEDAFANGDFDASADRSLSAEDLIDDASSVGFRRLLIVAGFLGLLALLIGAAFAISQFRQRELTEP